ncbi:MAG: nucleotide exchange factor GrpE [Patescibacteria group bacterium]
MEEKNKENKLNEEETKVDDVSFEETEEGSLASDPKKTIAKLREKLKEAEAVKNKYLDDLHRVKADFVNTTRKNSEDTKQIIKFANQNLILDIIPVLDSFDMAFSNKEAWESVSKNWRLGIEHIYSQLLRTLEGAGVKQLSPEGQVFNSEMHEILETTPTTKKEEDHKIISVTQKGYTLYERPIRPAKVKIFEYKD